MAAVHPDVRNTEARSNPTASTSNTPAMSSLKAFDLTALILMIIGGLNWGLIGLFQVDLVAMIFGDMTIAARAVYTLVGLAALYGIATTTRVARRLT